MLFLGLSRYERQKKNAQTCVSQKKSRGEGSFSFYRPHAMRGVQANRPSFLGGTADSSAKRTVQCKV